MDACLWLLRHGVRPDRVRWVMPRDSWLMNRANVQPGAEFLAQLGASFASRAQDVADASCPADLFDRLERSGNLLRIDPDVEPTMYHCEIVSLAELERLRTIGDVVRLGHVSSVGTDHLELQRGTIDAPRSLYIDCTASGLSRPEPVAVFDGERITLQAVRGCQQVFSAAFIAFVESTDRDDAARNALCRPVPHPDVPLDWLRIALSDNRAQVSWLAEEDVSRWLDASRLNLVRDLFSSLPPDGEARAAAVTAIGLALEPTNERLEALMAGV